MDNPFWLFQDPTFLALASMVLTLVYNYLFIEIEDKIYSATVLFVRGMFKSTFQFKNYFLNFMYLPTLFGNKFRMNSIVALVDFDFIKLLSNPLDSRKTKLLKTKTVDFSITVFIKLFQRKTK